MRAADHQLDQLNANPDGVIKLAIMAVGGQGGGVLTRWIERMARARGFACQATSVAGVAQRTGATIYYVEMAKAGAAHPVFALAPSPGDVDILIAAEMMEAGRAVIRGFVTPGRTTLIASSHRALAVSEKMAPGDGIANVAEVRAAAEIAAARFVCFDMESLAIENGSVISATLFGTLAATECLPFPKEAFEETIRAGGQGIDASIRAFRAAFDTCRDGDAPPMREVLPSPPMPIANGPHVLRDQWGDLVDQLETLPEAVWPITSAGLRKVVDFLDLDYGQDYLDRVATFAAADNAADDHALTKAAAKYIANAMAYDDVIRVADRKTRGNRRGRIASEMNIDQQQILRVTEYLHPRAEEIVGLLPAKLGERIEANPQSMARIDRWFARGRRLRSDRLGPFLLLYFLGGLKGYRRKTHRHRSQQAQLNNWLARALDAAAQDPALATEVLRCWRLIKGYSDTHARGISKFDKVIGMLDLAAARPDGADLICSLREAALQDEHGTELDEAIEKVTEM